MKLNFSRNIQFTRLIKVNGRLREFNFRKPNQLEESLFTVDVINDQGQRIVINMQKSEGTWKIITAGTPDWVNEKQEELSSIIFEELQKLGAA